MSAKTRDMCYRQFNTEPDIRVRIEYINLLQAMLEDEKAELTRQLNGPEVPLP